MAIVRVYFHRNPRRLARHVRYIAERPGSHGLRGLGPAFRTLNGDVAAVTRLLREHAAQVRTRAGNRIREGPFMRLLFTLPDGLAGRVMAADGYLSKGSQLVLHDAVEAAFRSVGRHLQGVYAVHFHSTTRRAHPHVHVDLSPLDIHGRSVFLTGRQRDAFRAAWVREVERALERAERRAAGLPRVRADAAHDRSTPGRRLSGATSPSAPRQGNASRSGSRRPPRPGRYLTLVASFLLGGSGLPILDLFTRALLARAQARLRLPLPNRAARAGFGLSVPLPARVAAPLGFFRHALRVPRRWQ